MQENRIDRRCVQLVRPAKGSGASKLRRLRLVRVEADTLVCHSWDGTTEGSEDIVVAKPWLLRKTPFDGQSRGGFSYSAYTADGTGRTSTGGTDPEAQAITPDWVAGDEIFAQPADTGVTGAELIDANLDGRCWARVSE